MLDPIIKINDENEAVKDRQSYGLYNGTLCVKVLHHIISTTQNF